MQKFFGGFGAILYVASASTPAGAQEISGQPDLRLELPTTGIAGEPDSFTLVNNPAGMQFLRGPAAGVAATGIGIASTDDTGLRQGDGVGVFASNTFGGNVFPKVGLGVAVEFLNPSSTAAISEKYARLTLASSINLSGYAIGVSWHHFVDGPLGGLDSFDVGYSRRFGKYIHLGAVVRDVLVPSISNPANAGENLRLERRYELEALLRPLGTSRVEVGLNGNIGERSGRWGAGGRLALRLFSGVRFLASFDAREHQYSDLSEQIDLRGNLGVEVSFAGLGLTAVASGDRTGGRDTNLGSGTLYAQIMLPGSLGVFPESRRIERIDLGPEISEAGAINLLLKLRRLEKDDDLVGLIVRADNFAVGWASLNEFRNAFQGLRKAGKKVVFYSTTGTTRSYFLASAADKIYVDPAGGIRLQGFSTTLMYFSGLFDLLGITAQFIRIEEYKSAPETFTETGPTEPAKEMRNQLLDELYGYVVKNISKMRKTSVATIKKAIDEGPYTAGDLENNAFLVDGIVEPDDLSKRLEKDFGGVFPVRGASYEADESWEYPKVAIIHIVGDIVDGQSRVVPILGRRVVGGQTISKAIAAARSDNQVKAIVLRINSPGGSALASELMTREVFKTRGVKPIICSLGDFAASGGYFVAAACDKIFADPMTITGSIGIFNGKFDVSGLLAKLGVSIYTYKRGKRAGLESPYSKFSDSELVMVKEKLRYYYNRFLAAVAKGRKMKPKDVDAIGRGHIWTGIAAKRNGLVDELGGIVDAVKEAKARAGMDEDELVQIMHLPTVKQSLLTRLFGRSPLPFGASDISGEAQLQPLPELGLLRGVFAAFPASLWVNASSPQARLPVVFTDSLADLP